MSAVDMGGIALDTSVIIPALLSWHAHHPAAQPVVGRAIRGQAPPVIPSPALVEAFSVMTRLPAPWRLSGTDAHALLARTFRSCARIVALDGEEAWLLLDRAVALGVSGGTIHDAHIVACARKAGVEHLATFNRRHFERLDLGSLTLLVPGEG